MRNQQTIPQFTCGHKLLDAASAELAAFFAATAELARIKNWAAHIVEELLPAKWTKQIEAAVGDDEKLAALRVVHSEKSLTLASIMLQDGVARTHTWERREALNSTLDKLIAEHGPLNSPSGEPTTLQRLIQSAVASIDQVLRDTTLIQIDTWHLEVRGQKAIREAGAVVVANAGAGPYWTEGLVVDGRKYLRHINSDVDLRRCFLVAPNDKDGRWPKAKDLYDVVVALEKALKELHEASSDLRSENGLVNEHQHASRLVGQLYGEGSSQLNEKSVEDQIQRRIAYNLKRSRFAFLLDAARKLRFDAAQALIAAAEEAKAAHALDNVVRMATSREVIDMELRAVNNLVAADEMLRRFGRELKEHDKTRAEDYSRGHGATATQAAFERVAQLKRPRNERATSKTS